jgi:hypothetical protein
MTYSFALVLVVCAGVGSALSAQAPNKPADKPAAPAAADKPAWPKLKQLDADRVPQLLANFKLDNKELHAKSVEELVALGPGAAPLLLARLSDVPNTLNPWLVQALDRVTTLEHTPLIAAEAGHKLLSRRKWSIIRLTDLGATDVAATYTKALADKDEEVAYRAAVGLAATGDAAGMERVFARAKTGWKEARAWLEPNLERGRGEALSKFLLGKLASKEFDDKVTALRLFRSCGTREQAKVVAAELDSSDHAVKKEAINALRVVVLEEKALDDLSVFQCIEMAKQIKSRL